MNYQMLLLDTQSSLNEFAFWFGLDWNFKMVLILWKLILSSFTWQGLKRQNIAQKPCDEKIVMPNLL